MTASPFTPDGPRLRCRIGSEQITLEALGKAAIRVRATRNARFDPDLPSGLLPELEPAQTAAIRVVRHRHSWDRPE